MAELKVIIQDETSTEQVTINKPATANKSQVQSPEVVASKASSKGLAIASMIGSRAFSYVTSNVGKWTGDSRKQTAVNNLMQVGSMAALAYVSPVIAIATVALNATTTAIDTSIEQKWDKKQSQQNQARAGYNSKNELVGRRR